MSDLTPEAIAAVDRQDMLGDVLAQPHQLADALWRVDSAGIGARELGAGLRVCGMGGSAIGADLAAAALGARAKRALTTVRGYEPEPWAAPDSLTLCASYSGNTEETLACYAALRERDLPRAVLTTGGRLAELARADRVPVIGVPSGMQPRAAVIYMTVAALECAALSGAAPSVRDEVERASALLATLGERWGPGADEASAAKALALRLSGTVPVVYGAGRTDAAALRFKLQLNENAEQPAFHGTLPEADHNELCGWAASARLAPLSAVFLDDDGLDPRLRRRIELTAATLGGSAAVVERVEAVGETPLERVLSLVLLGDLVSVYLAILRGVDPTPVAVLERFKVAL
ncbi:MAG: bifunctional phosphoglucose/phosphomannose isomerase [Thermoleophilaceae bacterium]